MPGKKTPTAEDLQKDLADFLRDKYGNQVQVGMQVHGQPDAPDEDEPAEDAEGRRRRILEFDKTPRDVKAYLDRFVIGQEEAKRALAIAICDHYNHVRECEGDPALHDVEFSKQNVLMVGPTGVGKTYLIRMLARLVGVPFVKADATKFSETGYVGGNVEDLVRDLLTQADGDVELAEYGIIYLDEVDKVATPPNIIGRDVSGRGVQMNLLKLMEETEVDLRSPFDPASQMQAAMELQRTGKIDHETINTRYILFIVSGAFTELADVVKRRLRTARMGFGGNVERDEDQDYTSKSRSDDFVKFGFEPEFIGRLPVHVFCHQLSVDHLHEILLHSEGSIVRQYERAFLAYGVEAVFEDEGLRAIAEQAHREQTGARGLMTVCERLFRDFKFELPSSSVSVLVVNRELVEQPTETLKRLLGDSAFRARTAARHQVLRYTRSFQQQYGVELHFESDAVDRLCDKAIEAGRDVYDMLEELFDDYQHGLSLIRRNTGQTQFTITADVIEDAGRALSEWIRDSYGDAPEASA